MNDPDDFIVWPDGGWCYGSELHEFAFMSDDCIRLRVGTPEWDEFFKSEAY